MHPPPILSSTPPLTPTSNLSNQPVGSIGNSTSNTKSTNHARKDKSTRMRTVLTEKQLLTLRTCYGANPRPDALMKEQLVEMTQLSPRVIRVWFQNKRKIYDVLFSSIELRFLCISGCKDKKRSIQAKQNQEQQKVLTSMNHGIPLIASSPAPNDMSIGLPPPSIVQVQYQSNGSWKTFNSYTNGHHIQMQQQTYNDVTGFASEDDSNCYDASQFSEERSDTSCDASGTSQQLTLL